MQLRSWKRRKILRPLKTKEKKKKLTAKI